MTRFERLIRHLFLGLCSFISTFQFAINDEPDHKSTSSALGQSRDHLEKPESELLLYPAPPALDDPISTQSRRNFVSHL